MLSRGLEVPSQLPRQFGEKQRPFFCLNYANDPTWCLCLPGTSLFPPVYPELPSQEWSSLTGLSARESATTSLDRPESTAHG